MGKPELNNEVLGDMGMVDRLLELGTSLYQCKGHRKVLETILSQTRAFSDAEAGSIYLVQNKQLKFVAVQNDTMDISEIQRHLLGKTMPVSDDSLAGYAASTREIINIPDSHNLRGAPFRINRDLDAETGYRIKSILAIPLLCPDGRCVGVLQLFNRLDEAGRPCAFENSIHDRLTLLATTAAMAVNNAALQDQLRQVHLHTIFRLSTIAEYRDSNTAEHIQRVSRVCELIAQAMGLDGETVELLKYATPMHDVGKVGIPDAILLKPGHLTAAQRAIMEKHTLYGGEIFGKPEHEILSLANEVALHHHERWDGEGYPFGLKGEKIPLSGRITAMADVFDAVVSHRCYKEAYSLEIAMDIIEKDTGKHFDPAVAEAFAGILDEVLEIYPSLGKR